MGLVGRLVGDLQRQLPREPRAQEGPRQGQSPQVRVRAGLELHRAGPGGGHAVRGPGQGRLATGKAQLRAPDPAQRPKGRSSGKDECINTTWCNRTMGYPHS